MFNNKIMKKALLFFLLLVLGGFVYGQERVLRGNLTVEGDLDVSSILYVDSIDEKTSDHGNFIGGGFLKDNKIGTSSNYWLDSYLRGINLLNAGGTNPSSISSNAFDDLLLLPGGTRNVVVFNGLSPNTSGSVRLGAPGIFWRDAFIDTVRVGNTYAYLSYSGTELQLTDAVTGMKTLAELAAGESYTFENGLIESAGTVKLGGALNTDTDLEMGTSIHFRVWTGAGYPSQQLLVTDGSGMAWLEAYNNSDNGSGIYLSSAGAAGYIRGKVSGTNYDTYIGTGGLYYAGDYSANYTARSLIDSAFAASLFEGITVTGTPQDNYLAIWTGANDLRHETDLYYEPSGGIFSILNAGVSNDHIKFSAKNTSAFVIQKDNADVLSKYKLYSNTSTHAVETQYLRYGGVWGALATAPTNAIIQNNSYIVWDGSSGVLAGDQGFQVDGVIATGDFDTKYIWDLKEGASASGLMLTLGVNGLEYNADHSIDQAANDRWLPDKAYVDAGGTSYWTKTGTDLSPATAGDDILLAVGTERLVFGDGNTWLYETSDNNLELALGGASTMSFSTTGTVSKIIWPYTTDTYDIGTNTYYWNDIYAQRWYVDEIGTYIYSNAGVLTFVDGTTGSKTLADLTAGGGGDTGDSIINLMIFADSVRTVLADTIPIDSVVRLKSDTVVVYSGTAGFAEAIDTSMNSTAAVYARQMIYVPDSVVFLEVIVAADSAGLDVVPSFITQLYYTTSWAVAGTALFSSAQTVSGATVVTTGVSFTSFANQIMPPGKYYVYAKTPAITNKFTAVNWTILGYYKNAPDP